MIDGQRFRCGQMKDGYNGIVGQLGGSKVKLCLDWLICHECERKQSQTKKLGTKTGTEKKDNTQAEGEVYSSGVTLLHKCKHS